mmetsp:Transcript_9792/g.13698  ORF Transcript_9792/g.13698 Transcript_9792/m.13698 type:complete len:93 (-) Transcript_9792:7-285(-)
MYVRSSQEGKRQKAMSRSTPRFLQAVVNNQFPTHTKAIIQVAHKLIGAWNKCRFEVQEKGSSGPCQLKHLPEKSSDCRKALIMTNLELVLFH